MYDGGIDSDGESPPEKVFTEFTPEQRTKRRYILQELLTTDQTYLRGLQKIYTVFLDPLYQEGSMEKKDYYKFSSINLLIEFHQTFIERTKQMMEDADRQPGDLLQTIFESFGELAALYSTFITAYEELLNTLSEMRQNRVINRHFRKQGRDGYDIQAYLVLPVQRITRYALLFRELKKVTPSDNPDMQWIEKIMDTVEESATFANESKRTKERAHALLEAGARLKGLQSSLYTPTRTLLYFGMVDFNEKDSAFVVCNDLVVVCDGFRVVVELEAPDGIESVELADDQETIIITEGISSDSETEEESMIKISSFIRAVSELSRKYAIRVKSKKQAHKLLEVIPFDDFNADVKRILESLELHPFMTSEDDYSDNCDLPDAEELVTPLPADDVEFDYVTEDEGDIFGKATFQPTMRGLKDYDEIPPGQQPTHRPELADTAGADGSVTSMSREGSYGPKLSLPKSSSAKRVPFKFPGEVGNENKLVRVDSTGDDTGDTVPDTLESAAMLTQAGPSKMQPVEKGMLEHIYANADTELRRDDTDSANKSLVQTIYKGREEDLPHPVSPEDPRLPKIIRVSSIET